MKYYHKSAKSFRAYVFFFTVVPTVVAVPIGYIVLLISGILDKDEILPKLVVLVVFYLLFLGLLLYFERRHKEYFEINLRSLVYCLDERTNKERFEIPARDITRLEFVKAHPDSEEVIYYIFMDKDAPFIHDNWNVPVDAMQEFCRYNGITPENILLPFFNVEEVKLGKKSIKLKYYQKWRKQKMLLADISAIELVSPHAFSTTESYYRIKTDSRVYPFEYRRIKPEVMEQYAYQHGIPYRKVPS